MASWKWGGAGAKRRERGREKRPSLKNLFHEKYGYFWCSPRTAPHILLNILVPQTGKGLNLPFLLTKEGKSGVSGCRAVSQAVPRWSGPACERLLHLEGYGQRTPGELVLQTSQWREGGHRRGRDCTPGDSVQQEANHSTPGMWHLCLHWGGS